MNRLNVEQAAEYLGVCTKTVYAMVQEKQVPHVRVRKRIFFTQDGLEKWVKQQEIESTGALDIV
ncbi:helix-turn-helix domain-containing protein [Jeotgalibacillus soli]|uniref:Helix-turn-helix domain-containing protein n=1 Tax=Jeotgalibacillus soli TaxID=889306 RepID=A0A0C2VMS3_9BACL|nr:helix-turn-helix domain-containing protein [Jeotgalibacillus soli]KIL45741.1 hypothetical protein KP78_20900 [Jeotgalibacillus soli]